MVNIRSFCKVSKVSSRYDGASEYEAFPRTRSCLRPTIKSAPLGSSTCRPEKLHISNINLQHLTKDLTSSLERERMFTGLVETIGNVASLQPLDSSASGGGGTSLTVSTINSPEFLSDAQLGDSICINGTCLTVTELPAPHTFKVGIAPETLRRTNLGSLSAEPSSPNSKVNLERALLPHTRMGGHFLQGHVDSIATIEQLRPDGNAVTFRLRPREREVLRYVVEKGYVGLDGASLTITAVNDDEGWFEVMLIAYTQEKIVMAKKNEGEDVNVEVDMVGKYVEKSVAGYFEGDAMSTGNIAILEKMVERIIQEKFANRS